MKKFILEQKSNILFTAEAAAKLIDPNLKVEDFNKFLKRHNITNCIESFNNPSLRKYFKYKIKITHEFEDFHNYSVVNSSILITSEGLTFLQQLYEADLFYDEQNHKLHPINTTL